MSEPRLEPAYPLRGRTVGDLEAPAEGEAAVATVTRDGHPRIPTALWNLAASGIVAVRADAVAVKRLLDRARLEFLATCGGDRASPAAASPEL